MIEVKIRVSPQELDRLGLKPNPYELLKELGINVISGSYDSFGPVYFLVVEDNGLLQLDLPDWAEKY